MSRSTTIQLNSIPTISQLIKNGTLKSGSSSTAYSKFGNQISLYQGDITKLEIDAIVNAANESLLGGGGVDGAIHKAAGSKLLEECKTLNGCKTGQAKITKGYNLPSNFVIHTVGPIYSKQNSQQSNSLLKSAYENSLEQASKSNLTSIAFPSISTGVYGFPIKEATAIAIETVGNFLNSKSGKSIERVIFCVFSEKDYKVYENELPNHFNE